MWRSPRAGFANVALLALVAIAALALLSACGGSNRPHPTPPNPEPRLGLSPTPAAPPAPSAATQPRTAEPSGSYAAAVPAPPPTDGSFGGSWPVSLVRAAPRGQWLAVCDATIDTNADGRVSVSIGASGELEGDRLDGALLDGAGGRERIDSFVGADPSGRYLAFVRGGRLALRDTTTRMDVILDADVRDDVSPFLPPRAAAFDRAGRRMLYLPARGGAISVRDLALGTEVTLTAAGEVYRAEFDASGEHVVARIVVDDRNGNGRLEWPVRQAKAPYMRCPAPIPRYPVWPRGGDEPRVQVGPSSGGALVDATGMVAPFGDSLIERVDGGALVRRNPTTGAAVRVTEATCAARVLHVDPGRGVLVTTCEKKSGRHDVVFSGKGGARSLGLELSVAAGDHVIDAMPRLLALHPGTGAALLDLDTGAVESLPAGDHVVATSGAHALLLRGGSLVFHDWGGKERAEGSWRPGFEHVLEEGSVVVVPPLVADVAAGALLGRVPAGLRPLAVAVDGALLVPQGGPADATRLATGPLRWVKPEPAAPPP